jgi:hypothetical protein
MFVTKIYALRPLNHGCGIVNDALNCQKSALAPQHLEKMRYDMFDHVFPLSDGKNGGVYHIHF